MTGDDRFKRLKYTAEVAQLRHHPGYVENLANSSALSGRIRRTDDSQEIVNAVVVLIRNARLHVDVFADPWVMTDIIREKVVSDALEEFLTLPASRLRIICGYRGLEVVGSGFHPDFSDWEHAGFRALRRQAGTVFPPVRFVVTDAHSWWYNRYERDSKSLDSVYAFHNRLESGNLKEFFDKQFEPL